MSEFVHTFKDGYETLVCCPEPGTFDGARFNNLIRANQELGLDSEFTGGGIWADGATTRLLQLAGDHEAWVLDMTDPAQWEAAAEALSRPRTYITHWAQAEASVAHREFGLDLTHHERLEDTYVLSRLADPGRPKNHDLKYLASEHLDSQLQEAEDNLVAKFRELWKAEGNKHGLVANIKSWGFSKISNREPTYLWYAGLDAIYVRRLRQVLKSSCRDLGIPAETVEREQRINRVAVRMHVRGWRVDEYEVRRQLGTVGSRNSKLSAEFERSFKCLPRSPARAEVLRGMGVQFTRFTPKGNPKLGMEEVRELVSQYPGNEALKVLLEIAETENVTRFLTTLKECVGHDGRVRSCFRTLGTVTGRWTITSPATQTVSVNSGTRKAFLGLRDGDVLLSADLANIEPRVAAGLADCRALIKQFRAGEDAYRVAAEAVGGKDYTKYDRKIAKRIVLGSLYAAGVRTLVEQARYTDGMMDVTEEQISYARKRFNDATPEIGWLGRRLQSMADVRLKSGRFVPHDPQRKYKALNSLVQGTARDELMVRLLGLVDAGLDSCLVTTLHDEVLLSVPRTDVKEVAHVVRECMELGFKHIPTPSDIEVYPRSWGDDLIPIGEWCG